MAKSKHGKDVTVAPHPKGWSVTRRGNRRASVVTTTQKQAQDIGRRYARQEHSELIVKGRKGRIRAKDSHGHDPRSSKG